MMWWFALAGLLFGLIGGMGRGGGIILIPVLTLFLGVSQHGAQGLNLLAFLPMAIFASIAHCKKKKVDYKLALFLAGGGLAGALIGAWLAGITGSETLRFVFGLFLIALGLMRAYGLIRRLVKKKKQKAT